MEMKNAYPHPVPIARLVIANSEGKVLILRRQNSAYGSGLWCLPGGKIDYGETAEEGGARELREETSLRCDSARFLFFQDSLPLEPGNMHCINLYFECVVSGATVLNEESSEFAWIGPADVARYEITFRNDLGLKRYWKEKRGE